MEIFQSNYIELDSNPKTFYFLGDIHEGNCNHAEKEFKESIKIISEDKYCEGIFVMGDVVDCIINSHDPRFNPIEIASEYKIKDLKDLPRKQSERVYKKMKPIEDKVLACVCGNHEEQYIKRHSFNVYDHYCNLFSSKPVKIGYTGFYRLRFKRKSSDQRYKLDVSLNHGVGGGGFREGYPLNKLYDVFRWIHADICVMGHIHTLMEDSQIFKSVGQNLELKRNNVLYGISGCYLRTSVEGQTNYFEHKGKPEAKIGMLKLTVTKFGRKGKLQTRFDKIEFK